MLEQSDIKIIKDLLEETLEEKLEQKLEEKLSVFRDEIIDGIGEIVEKQGQEIELIKTNYVTKSQMKVALEDLERKIA